MRSVLDEDVDISVARYLREHDHDVWTVVEAGLGGADDDSVAIYADDRGAILITHDAEAVHLLEEHLPELVELAGRQQVGVFEVRHNGVTFQAAQHETD